MAKRTAPPSEPAAKLRRLTVDVDEALARRIKSACAAEGVNVGATLRALLEREWPANGAEHAGRSSVMWQR